MYKKFFLVTALVLAAAAGLSTAVVQAASHAGSARDGDKRLQRMTKELKLTAAQQAQIKTILQTERAKIKPLRQELRQNHMAEAKTANAAGTFDEAQVRAYAAKQAQIMTDLTVERERTKSEIFAVLTPVQRDKEQALIQQHLRHSMHKHSQSPANTTTG